jgi:hypothetical protein
MSDEKVAKFRPNAQAIVDNVRRGDRTPSDLRQCGCLDCQAALQILEAKRCPYEHGTVCTFDVLKLEDCQRTLKCLPRRAHQ